MNERYAVHFESQKALLLNGALLPLLSINLKKLPLILLLRVLSIHLTIVGELVSVPLLGKLAVCLRLPACTPANHAF